MNPRIIDKTTIINDSISTSQTATPFIVRIPHIQTKSTLNSEGGKVVIIKSTGQPTSLPVTSQQPTVTPSTPSSTKSFSVVKLADGQIVLVPNPTQPQQVIVNENGISRIIKTQSTSPPNPTGIISTIKRVTKEQNTPRISTIQLTNLTSPPSQQQTQILNTSPTERRLRAIAPAPGSLLTTPAQILNSILTQQQLNAVNEENLLRFDPTASVLLAANDDDSLPVISETVTLDSNGSSLKQPQKRKIESQLPIERQTLLPVVVSPSVVHQPKPKVVKKTPPNDEKSSTKARLENKATSIIKDSRKTMTPRQTPTAAAAATPQPSSAPVVTPPAPPPPPPTTTTTKTATSEAKSHKTPIRRPAAAPLPPKIDPEEGIRMKICETILRSLIGRVEREQNQESIKTRLEKHSTTIPKTEHRQIILTRLLNERVDLLRQEFMKNRSERKTVLLKEQFQLQRLKQQQQMILKQQQQRQQQPPPPPSTQLVNVKSDEDFSPPVKKSRKSNGIELKLKKPKPSEPTPKSTIAKRTRPLLADHHSSSPAKKIRRSETVNNDENLLTHRKSSSKSKLVSTINNIVQRKGNKLSADFRADHLDCICKQNDDLQEKFFIQCELCSRWLHGKCVNLTGRFAEKIREFICQDCAILTHKAKERLYCLCRTPYDDSK